MSQTTVQTANETITARSQERVTMAAMLNGIASEIQLNHPNDPRGQSLFLKNKNFRTAFRRTTGWKGNLTELGFDLIREQAAVDVGDAVDDNGYPCELTLVKSPWGRLFAAIVRIVCLQFGEAEAITFLYRSGGMAVLENDRQLAMVMAEKLIAPEATQMGTQMSMVQEVLRKSLNVKQLIVYIRNNIRSYSKNHFESVELGRKFNPFKQRSAVCDFLDDEDSVALMDPCNLAGDVRERDTEEHVLNTLCAAFSELPEHLRGLMLDWLESVRTPELESKRTFVGQLVAIGPRWGLNRRQATLAAEEITKSLRQTFGVVIEKREVRTKVAKSSVTRNRIRRGELTSREIKAAFIDKDVRDDVALPGVRLENEGCMEAYGHAGFEVGSVLNTERTSGCGLSAEVLSSDIEDLFSIFYKRNAPFDRLKNALN